MSSIEVRETEQDIVTNTSFAAIFAAMMIARKVRLRITGMSNGSDDEEMQRSSWTSDLVNESYNENPKFNYVVVCTNHSHEFDGFPVNDWSSRTYDYRLRNGLIRYTVYAFRSGVFTLQGDGGRLNWAYKGRVVPDSENPRRIVFRK